MLGRFSTLFVWQKHKWCWSRNTSWDVFFESSYKEKNQLYENKTTFIVQNMRLDQLRLIGNMCLWWRFCNTYITKTKATPDNCNIVWTTEQTCVGRGCVGGMAIFGSFGAGILVHWSYQHVNAHTWSANHSERVKLMEMARLITK